MVLRYANEDDVRAGIAADAAESDVDWDAVVRLENGLCDNFDHKVGRSWGTAAVAETRTIHAGPVWGIWQGFGWPVNSWYASGPLDYSERLILDIPLRSLTGIETGGTWNGTDWDDGTALVADDYRLTNHTNQGYYAIDLTAGTWSGVVRIAGVWGDQDEEDVPDDVRQAMTFLTVNQWLLNHASPAGFIGPDGLQVTPRNPWAFEIVKAAIDRHTVVGLLV